MFWDAWIPKKFLVKQEICAVEYCMDDSGVSYYITHLKQKNNKLELISTETGHHKLVLPNKIIKNKIPVVLIFNGKGIVIKKINILENDNDSLNHIVTQNLPALNVSEFYIQLYRQEDKSAFITLCRKELVNILLEELNLMKVEVASVFLGAPTIRGLQPLWSNFNFLQTSLQHIQLNNNSLETISNKLDEHDKLINFQFETINISPNYLLGFAGGISYLMQRQIKEDSGEELSKMEIRHTEKNKFRFLAISAVAIAFVLSVGNLFLYTSYFDKNSKLETELAVYQGKYEEVNKLLNDYQKNKNLIENAGILNKNSLSEFADRIGASMPDDITLSDLYFNPKKSNDNENDSLVSFDNKSMIIKGNCDKSMIINEWLNVLKAQKFVKDISLEKYGYNNDGFQPNFEIKLLIAP